MERFILSFFILAIIVTPLGLFGGWVGGHWDAEFLGNCIGSVIGMIFGFFFRRRMLGDN